MKNVNVLSGLCESLKINAANTAEVLTLGGFSSTKEEAIALLSGEVECSNDILTAFLDGLILQHRGPREGGPAPAAEPGAHVTNNDVLKKVRIALNLREPELLSLFAKGGRRLTKHELTPLYRKKGHKHHKRCDDETLEVFFSGLSLRAPAQG